MKYRHMNKYKIFILVGLLSLVFILSAKEVSAWCSAGGSGWTGYHCPSNPLGGYYCNSYNPCEPNCIWNSVLGACERLCSAHSTSCSPVTGCSGWEFETWTQDGCGWSGSPDPDPDPDPPPGCSCPDGRSIWCTWEDCGACSGGSGTCPGEPNCCCCPPPPPTYAKVEFRAFKDENCNGLIDDGEESIGKQGGEVCGGGGPDDYICPPEGCPISWTGGSPTESSPNPITDFHNSCTDWSGHIPRIQRTLKEGDYVFTFHAPSGWQDKTIPVEVRRDPDLEEWRADVRVNFLLCPVGYYTIAGYVRDSVTDGAIPGTEVDIYDGDLGATQRVTTDASGHFSIAGWAREGDYYAVRPVGVPSGYVTPPATTTAGWTWNYCINSNPGTNPWADTPLGSYSYECQLADAGADCAGPDGSGTTERCNFEFDPEPYCGDGTFTPGVEECEDDNTDNTDYCNVEGTDKDGYVVYPRCSFTYCGDGIIQTPNGKGINPLDPGFVEHCDDGNNDGGDGCSFDCLIEGEAWMVTEDGDVFSQVGFDFGGEGLPAGRYLSNYLCLKGLGGFDVGGAGCSFRDWEYDDDPNNTRWRDYTAGEIDTFFDSVRAKIDAGQLTGVNVEEYPSDHSLNGLNVNGLMLRWAHEDLTITGDITYAGGNESTEGLICLVDGNVSVESNVARMDGLYLVKGDVDISGGSDLVQLNVDGGMIVIGQIDPNRTLGVGNDTDPAEKFTYDPRYIDIFREFFGDVNNIQFIESGVY